jgi:ribosomal protein L12E/L44/L45/RPP1/RPP2
LKAAAEAARIISGGLKLLGFSSAAKGVDTSNAIKDGSAAAAATAAAQGKLDSTKDKHKKTQLDYQK